MGKCALYPGSFDPIHFGHMDIAQRAAALFDRLVIAVYEHPNKRLWFSAEERVAFVREALRSVPNIEVRSYSELTTAFADSVGAQVLVRGLRVISDFELEYQMALTNKALAPHIETVCLMTRQEHAFLSSSIVKEVCSLGGDISTMVPPHVVAALLEVREKAVGAGGIPLVSLRD
ncbi:MAG TPA: pantetheine-phosphate adenylyltransferase [Anaerolineae bacterium]|nr:pantetheine-phosphate adenylyltransferase [Anaerolineae bacterium]HOV48365.1 pantetheine-phosphate adenylyltransferase [Anaerolineae bacterium]HPD41410.1 pantetheine-phosphate adenylyltransferase [Anaerolineae bacterium]HQE98466.1 pantetheine-phosphate adenylyltransferase [Anaerolineae bacterium]HRT30883.1 pantetheine-phosphate adenylyltransferase [Anaerolineae bacterium]